MVDMKALTLGGLADGAAEELFADALRKVLENIEDPNTDWRARRRITLTFDFTAEEDRHTGDVVVAAAAKLAGVKGLKVGIFYGRNAGVPSAVEGPKQETLFTQPAGGPRAIAAAGKV